MKAVYGENVEYIVISTNEVSIGEWIFRTIVRVIICGVLLFSIYWILSSWSVSRAVILILTKDGLWWGFLYYAGLTILFSTAESLICCVFNFYSKKKFCKLDNMEDSD